MNADQLGILSVFETIDGEVNIWGQGGWTIFVRTRGCTVGCHWCDTKYSWSNKGGVELDPEALVDKVKEVGGKVRKVTITGGEPLEQLWNPLRKFIRLLVEQGYNISMETSGTEDTISFRNIFDSAGVPIELSAGQLTFIVDYKLRGSQFKGRMDLFGHFRLLKLGDIVKFVISDSKDFDEAADIARWLQTQTTFKARMYFSPAHGTLDPAELLRWMTDKGLDQIGVGLNVQAHKYIWPADWREEEDAGFDVTKRSLGREQYLQQIRDAE